MSHAPAVGEELRLAFGLVFSDLYDEARLPLLDATFLDSLKAADTDLHGRLNAARCDPTTLSRRAESDLLIDLAPHLEDFLGRLFGIEREVEALAAQHARLAPLSIIKRKFVQRKAMTLHKADEAATFDGPALETALSARIGGTFSELAFATHLQQWLQDEAAHAEDLALATRYAAWSAHTPAGRHRHAAGVLFRAPQRLEPMALVPVSSQTENGYTVHTLHHIRRNRQDKPFALTDGGADLAYALDQANYCIWCHEQGKDSCSTGLRDKPGDDGKAGFKKSPFGVPLAGCPLDEKISEFHKVKTAGLALAALAIITVDNPMAAATGHRICNDCMKSCIYQRQDPVNIPQAETRTLRDVLALPWGFEIYSLLTRWNPLNVRRPLPLPASGRRALVVGMGPAGFTLAHHLLNDGHLVVGIDGLKIEPLPPALAGVDAHGKRVPFTPVRDIAALHESLDDRLMAGFGGVAEYGITVRWDKNFLKVVRLLIERRARFRLHGGVRFGGTLSTDDAFAVGFDHVALAMGAGRPTVLDLPNGLARGVRTASDFLMGLQLTGAAKLDSIANLQVRLPIVVIGGGLTAIDTATESLAYYPRQVEKFLARYEVLAAERGEAAVRAAWRDDEAAVADEYLAHARAIRAERTAADEEGRQPRIIELLQTWGGATIAYRKRLIDSPAYTLNHEEVEKALEEGIRFAEGLTPSAIEVDGSGWAKALRCHGSSEVLLPARTILIAAGTQPNTVLAREEPGHYRLQGKYFQAVDGDGQPVTPERSAKPQVAEMRLLARSDGRGVSFFGDLHPSFFGNVVKAMASAKRGYPQVSAALRACSVGTERAGDAAFLDQINEHMRARVHAVHRLTPTIVEVVLKAPLAARQFQPGQFYRLQNFESHAPCVAGTRLAMEGLALTGASVDREAGLLSTIVLEMGGSSDLCALLKPGEPVILMGPTGAPTEVGEGETLVLVGGGLGNAVLFSIGALARQRGSKVLYFAGYKKRIDRYKVAQIEAAADEVVWCCDESPGFTLHNLARPQDKTFVGNIVAAMQAHAAGGLGSPTVRLQDAQRLIVIGSDRMMAAVAAARHGVLASAMRPEHVAIGSINSPMQCMMKEICAQCLQPHIDPETGETRYVFSCFNQDQALDAVDWHGLNQRLNQNSVQEKLTAQWVDRTLRAAGLRAS